jgi:redox-sensitive bicupin YhaK (pirin superfamily)
MFWAETVPVYTTEDNKASATLFVGNDYFDVKKNPNNPPPNSWAADPVNDVVLCHMTIQPGGKLVLPKAHEETASRSLYYIEGKTNEVLVDGEALKSKVALTLDPTIDGTLLEVPESASGPAEFLLLQGKPIREPVAQYGPFVMNTQHEIMQAFSDYQETEFGGWPWPRDDMVFPKTKGRFALFDGKESVPPTKSDDELASSNEEKKDSAEL